MNVALSLFRAKNRMMGTLFPAKAAQHASELFLSPRKFPLKDWEQNMEQRGRRLALDNGLSAIVWGDSARRILLVHGWESRATQMSGFVEALLAADYQVIAVDGPAHGQSSGNRANPYLFSRAVLQVYAKLGPFEGVVGHSMGGNAVATAIAEGLECPKVVLISSPSSIESVLKRFAKFVGLPKNSAHEFVRLVEEAVGKPARALDTAANLRDNTSEGLVIHDMEDREIPYREALEIVKHWKSSSLFSTEGYGHRAIVRQDRVWNKVAEFLA